MIKSNHKILAYVTAAFGLGAYRGFNKWTDDLYVRRGMSAIAFGIFYTVPGANLIPLITELERLECKIRGIKYE